MKAKISKRILILTKEDLNLLIHTVIYAGDAMESDMQAVFDTDYQVTVAQLERLIEYMRLKLEDLPEEETTHDQR